MVPVSSSVLPFARPWPAVEEQHQQTNEPRQSGILHTHTNTYPAFLILRRKVYISDKKQCGETAWYEKHTRSSNINKARHGSPNKVRVAKPTEIQWDLLITHSYTTPIRICHNRDCCIRNFLCTTEQPAGCRWRSKKTNQIKHQIQQQKMLYRSCE